MPDSQSQIGLGGNTRDALPDLPLDGRHLLGINLPGRKRRQARQLASAEFSSVRNLCLLAVLFSLLLAMVLVLTGRMSTAHTLPAVLPGVTVAVIWLVSRMLVIPRSRIPLWQGTLLILCLLQAVVWAIYVLRSVPLESQATATAGLLAMVLLLAPLLYWLPMFLLGLLLVAGVAALLTPASPHLGAVLTVLSTVLVMGLVAAAMLARKRQADWREQEALNFSAQLKSDMADQSERINYEQDQRGRVERDLQAVRELAESAAQAKTEFLATISHEIRTPLNGILPILEILHESPLNEEQQRYVRTAFSSSRHLLRIINDILDFARAESGKLQLESIEFDLHELLSSVIELMHSSAGNKGLKLKLSIADEVPQVLRGDPIRLRQILTNLLSNAVKFTDNGSVKLSVKRRRASRKEVELLYAVNDTGIGMSRDTSRQVFHSFTQADASTTRKHGGTGLGLVICKRLVELMGGRIGVRSRLGEGSEFWFVLPMRRSVQEVPPARKDLQGVRLMSLIRDPETARAVAAQLAKWGVMAEEATLDDAVSRLHTAAMLGRSWAYELLLVDSWASEQVLLPVLRELRADPLLKDMRVVVSSRSPEIAERLHREFAVYTLSGGMRSAPLRRCLYRLFDVEGDGGSGESGGTPEAFRDLNLEREDALYEIEDQALPQAQTERAGRVLLVEDNPVNLGVVRRVLDRLGVTVIVAHNGREALEQLQGQRVDLVFMDCQMPVMDGYEATCQWRKTEQAESKPPLPIIAMTANAMQGDREKCLDAGMDDYLAKPVSIADLRGTLEQWMPPGYNSPARVDAAPKPSATTAVKGVLDGQVLSELREVMEDEFEELVATYLGNAPDLVGQLAQAAGRRDLEAMVIPAHSLKSSSANLGAMQLSEVARSIETAAREGRLEDALAARQQLDDVFKSTCDALHSQLSA